MILRTRIIMQFSFNHRGGLGPLMWTVPTESKTLWSFLEDSVCSLLSLIFNLCESNASGFPVKKVKIRKMFIHLESTLLHSQRWLRGMEGLLSGERPLPYTINNPSLISKSTVGGEKQLQRCLLTSKHSYRYIHMIIICLILKLIGPLKVALSVLAAEIVHL